MSIPPQAALLAELPILQRLALSYSIPAVRQPTLALLALDTRLAAILRAAREPMLAQLRLAWWREQLKADPASWPSGEPLLAVLQSWAGRREVLAGLVDGWEAMTGPAPLPEMALVTLGQARGQAFAALAGLVGAPGEAVEAARLGEDWAYADLVAHLGHPEEQACARRLAEGRDWRRASLGRRLRPLIVLRGLAKRATIGGAGSEQRSPVTLLAAMRLGLLGR